MNRKPVYVGNLKLIADKKSVNGAFVRLNNELFYKIANYDQMKPFFMTIVSYSDHWMFIWTNGALSAGRRNPDNALFPYYTEDKIFDSADITGNKTIVLVESKEKTFLWEPFSEKYTGLYQTERNIYKNLFGNKIIFEEINLDLNIIFKYCWCTSEKYGFVKHSTIFNLSDADIKIQLLDGIQNILPAGVKKRQQEEYSTLVDAYKKNELDTESGLGLFTMSSIQVDKAEPSEALKATTVWSAGFDSSVKLLSANQLDRFRTGLRPEQELDVNGTRGAYFDVSEFHLSAKQKKDFYLVADVDQNTADVFNLRKTLSEQKNLIEILIREIAEGTTALAKIVASADGLQQTSDKMCSARHYSNVLFNVMRGGVFENNYQVRKSDLLSSIKNANINVYDKHHHTIEALSDVIDYLDLLKFASNEQDTNLERLILEYLPITFSRRHGDPSRPWNLFSIDVKNEDGSKLLSYQGNWRDIFQNWEALCLSFPGFIESMISKFLNASTIDGYNPYRITRDGIDWEIIDPDDPWSNIGYWGDHQIIYLLKLLELSDNYHPQMLKGFLTKKIFSYANVPYRIKPYESLLEDSKNTIEFDKKLDKMIEQRVSKTGSDGKLLWDENNQVYHTNLIEKLLTSVLSKFTNFIPEAGIWLNTQRPEWNDANNALVGAGVSMVTLYYMRRFQFFFLNLLKKSHTDAFEVSKEIKELFNSIYKTFINFQEKLQAPISDKDRRRIMDDLGKAGSRYRNTLYTHGFCGSESELSIKTLTHFLKLSLKYIDHSIKANKRDDNLYHSYNLMKIENDGSVSIRYLYEMLEGQVAVLSSGYLKGNEALALLAALKSSALYREDQHSYILYPNRILPRFMEKNNISESDFSKSELLQKLTSDGNKDIVVRDIDGGVHFSGNLRNADVLKEALNELKTRGYADITEKDIQLVLKIYENVFDHQSFTGRSGTFYKYEGLGCIYWHMVSKLLFVVLEIFYNYIETENDKIIAGKLIEYYYDIRAGIGLNKTAENYGAFPMDPYSHTPAHLGAQQPGMTGQVKEDILSRFGELGVKIRDGKISFRQDLLRKEEFLKEADSFKFYDVFGNERTIRLEPDSLAFTIAQVAVIYHRSKESRIIIHREEGASETVAGLTLNDDISASIFNRKGEIQKIDVFFETGK